VKEHPILFNGEMVRAILDGRKTQTRRIIKPQPKHLSAVRPYHLPNGLWKWVLETGMGDGTTNGFASPYQIGDVLWVRESARLVSIDGGYWRNEDSYCQFEFLADGMKKRIWFPERIKRFERGKCCPNGCFRELARLFPKVTGVRVERVQDISEEDARKEGIVDGGCLNCGEHEPCGCDNPKPDARDSFCWLWNSIYAKRGFGWDANPWVWVNEFERIKEGAEA
jgi:hypothetical protein